MSHSCSGDPERLAQIGHIQGCGYLFAVQETTTGYPSGLRIVTVSQNIMEAPWVQASSESDILGKDLGDMLREECVQTVRALVTRYTQASQPRNDRISPKVNRTTADIYSCPAAAHAGLVPGEEDDPTKAVFTFTLTGSNPGVYLVEVERKHGPHSARAQHTPGLLQMTDLMGCIPVGSNSLVSTAALCDALAENMPAYERVVVYRFAPDGHGEVIHECIKPGCEVESSFLGCHFPASDIPPIARKLLMLKGVSFIADTSGQRVAIRSIPERSSTPLDLSRSALRAPSPCHEQFLRNMGVRASMAVAITVGGELWGNINFHAYTRAVHPSCEERILAETTVTLTGALIMHYERQEIATTALALSRMLGRLKDYPRVNDFLSSEHQALRDILEVDTIVLYEHSRSATVYGKKDISLTLSECIELLNGDGPGETLCFRSLEAKGVAFFSVNTFLIVFLRENIADQIKWAGNPEAIMHDGEVVRPRASFQQFMGTPAVPFKLWSPATTDLLNMVRRGFSSKIYADALPAAQQETFAHVSHELRTPFHGVMGSLEMLEEGHGTMEAEEQLGTIHSAVRCGKSMLSTLDDILDIAKNRNNTEVARRRFAASSPILLAVDAMKPFAITESVELTAETGPPDDTFEVVGDMRRIKTVVQNLVNNAIKFTPRGGKVAASHRVLDSLQDATDWWTKETNRFEASTWIGSPTGDMTAVASQDARWHVYCVEDSGVGVLPADLPHLVAAYKQVSHGVQKSYAGTGLGLHICKAHVEAMFGALGIASTFAEESTSGGTLFAVILPLCSVEEAGAVVDAGSNADDHTVNVKLIEHKIRRHFRGSGADVQVLSATDGLMALDVQTAARHVRVGGSGGLVLAGIFMDFHLPNLDGIECTRRIRVLEAANGWPRVTICGCTADVTEGVRSSFQDAGGDEVILKPWRPGQVERACNVMVAKALDDDHQSGVAGV
ncbi:Phytochrome-like protein [Ectocarpus siliculosus]|uniref:histidine kinase n=1 Tax=Ectocarpus siliculosus TaxID=2880 RepID=D7G163_ECTSI|nr:Phytochrome-like protein [Ectocarpus siliculosus]|eukprot:CBJ33173.1 Phytochrome-like protein [Ectocarpus siliculosus]